MSNSTSPTTAAIAPIDFNSPTTDSLRTEQQMQLESQAGDEEEEEDPTSQQQIFVSMGEESIISDASRSGVDSNSGVMPGSRRLHLPATGRLASYRASVPAPNHTNAFSGISKQNNAAALSSAAASAAISSSSTCEESLERCVGPTMLQQSVEVLRKDARYSLVSAAVQTSAEASEMETSDQIKQADSRFAEVEAEVLRLKEEREKATQQVEALTSRLKELEVICERLTEENVSFSFFMRVMCLRSWETSFSAATKQKGQDRLLIVECSIDVKREIGRQQFNS